MAIYFTYGNVIFQNYLQGSNGDTDIENRLMDTGWGGGEGRRSEMYGESNMETEFYSPIFKQRVPDGLLT